MRVKVHFAMAKADPGSTFFFFQMKLALTGM